MALTISATGAQAQTLDSAAARTLVLARVQAKGPAFVRTLALTDELERLRAEGRADMPTFERARGLGDLGGCFLIGSDAVEELTKEVTCGGGTGLDAEFDPIGEMEKMLDPQIDLDSGEDRDRDEPSSGEEDRNEDYSSADSAEPSYDVGVGFKVKNGVLHLCGYAAGTGGCTDEIKLGSGGAALTTEEELRWMQDMQDEGEPEKTTAEKAAEYWAKQAENSESQEEEAEPSPIAEAVGKVFDWLEEHAEEEESSSKEDDSTSDDSSAERPQEGDVVTVPTECEEAVADRLDSGGVDPIDPHPDDAVTDSPYVGCFVDATIAQDLAGCVVDLAARRTPDQASLCAGQEAVVDVPLMTRNDLVIDDIAPDEVASATALATELAARLQILRVVEAGTEQRNP
jgi:hypothetical protein